MSKSIAPTRLKPIAPISVAAPVAESTSYKLAGPLEPTQAAPYRIMRGMVHWPKAVLVVTLAGQLITGGVVSLTRIVWLQLAVLPLLSVAVHVRVIRLLQLVPGLDSLWLKLTATLPSQLSLAVTVAAAATAP